MELIFTSASTLGLNHEFEFIGETFNFKNRKDLSIQGELLELDNFSGVAPIWSGIEGIISNQKEYSNIILNGVSFGSGRLNSISFGPGVDVRRKTYSANLSVYSSGDISNLNQSGYSGLYTGFLANNFSNVRSLSESFDFQRNPDNTYTYNRQLDISIISGTPDYAQNQAKNLAKVIFSSDISFPFLNQEYPNFYEASGRKLYSENYNLINNEFSFSESFNFQDSDNFIWTYTHSSNLDQNGEIIVTEEGKFRGVNLTDYAAALAAFNSNFSSSFSRCSVILNYYYSSCSLKSTPISVQISRNTFIGEISYTISYSTNPKYVGSVIWDYTFGAELSNGNYVISEKGSVVGLGSRSGRYSAALSYFNASVSSNIASRINTYYSGFATLLSATCTPSFIEESRSITHYEFEGKIEYDFRYSNDSRLRNSGGLSFVETNVSNSSPVPIVSIVPILGNPNSEFAIPVYRGNSSLGKFAFSVKITPSSTTRDLNFLVQQSRSQISKSLIPSSEYYLKDVSYNYDYNNKAFELNAEFDYVKHRTLNDIRII